MTCSIREPKPSKPLLSKEMVARFRNAFLPNTTCEQRRRDLKFRFANHKAYGDEGRLPSILSEPRDEDLLLEDTRRSSSGCMLERRTDVAQSAREDEECRGWIGAHQRVLRNKHRR